MLGHDSTQPIWRIVRAHHVTLTLVCLRNDEGKYRMRKVVSKLVG